jgi:hypothetical protein
MDNVLMSEKEHEVEPKPAKSNRIRALQDQIADLKKRWPAHSAPPAMMQLLDELEEELENELAYAKQSKKAY